MSTEIDRNRVENYRVSPKVLFDFIKFSSGFNSLELQELRLASFTNSENKKVIDRFFKEYSEFYDSKSELSDLEKVDLCDFLKSFREDNHLYDTSFGDKKFILGCLGRVVSTDEDLNRMIGVINNRNSLVVHSNKRPKNSKFEFAKNDMIRNIYPIQVQTFYNMFSLNEQQDDWKYNTFMDALNEAYVQLKGDHHKDVTNRIAYQQGAEKRVNVLINILLNHENINSKELSDFFSWLSNSVFGELSIDEYISILNRKFPLKDYLESRQFDLFDEVD